MAPSSGDEEGMEEGKEEGQASVPSCAGLSLSCNVASRYYMVGLL